MPVTIIPAGLAFLAGSGAGYPRNIRIAAQFNDGAMVAEVAHQIARVELALCLERAGRS